MWALASVVQWHGTALLTVAVHADTGLSAPAVICQTERMQGSEFLELIEWQKRWRKWGREGWHEKKPEHAKTGSRTNARIYTWHTRRHTHGAVDAPLSVWHWCCQTNQGTLSLRLACSLVLEKKPDSCDVVTTLCLSVAGLRGLRVTFFLGFKCCFQWFHIWHEGVCVVASSLTWSEGCSKWRGHLLQIRRYSQSDCGKCLQNPG